MSAVQVFEEICRLSPDEQRKLMEMVRDEFGDPSDEPTAEQLAIFEERAERLFRNPETGIPWEQVRAEAEERLKRKRECGK